MVSRLLSIIQAYTAKQNAQVQMCGLSVTAMCPDNLVTAILNHGF